MFESIVNFSPKNYDTFITSDNYIVKIYDTIEGAFALRLYKNSAEPNRIDKTNYISIVDNIFGVLREETSIVNPVITIEYDKVPDFNYVYIDVFKRYYFVVGVTSVNNGLWSLELNCDVLMSYKDAILNCEAFVDRNEYEYNSFIDDSKRPVELGSDKYIVTINNNLFETEGIYAVCAMGFKVEEE